MNKVYILFKIHSPGYYEQEKSVEDVFASLESLEKYKEKHPLGKTLYCPHYEVEDFEVVK